MDKEHWEELVAQVDEHGPETIKFWLEEADHRGPSRIYVTDVTYDDGEIKVICT
jgi:hypothetical protein